MDVEPLATLHAFEITTVLQPPLAMGEGSGSDATGFATSALKEYPEALGRGLAQLISNWMSSYCTAPGDAAAFQG